MNDLITLQGLLMPRQRDNVRDVPGKRTVHFSGIVLLGGAQNFTNRQSGLRECRLVFSLIICNFSAGGY